MPAANATVVESQLRRARTDLEEGLRAFADPRAEALLAAYPAVAADHEAALELVYTEFVIREQLGQNPDPEGWYRRFPHWKSDLEQMFEVHRELKKEDTLRKSRAAPVGPATRPETASGARRIGEFEILSELGRGGMGVVYRARQPSLGRTVAVKVILAGAHAGTRERERFRREAETAARLDHSNIVRIFEVGEHDGRAFCAMEYVDGAPLSDLLDGRPWPPRKAAELIVTVAAAARHAHDNGVIHRDLKPGNILIVGARKDGHDGRTDPAGSSESRRSDPDSPAVKIVDFGLAKSLTDTDPGPTRTGDLIGTPTYMAPEQADPSVRRVGPPTDVWAMGVTLYELLVGHPPFRGDSSVETLQQVRDAEPVPPRRLRPTLPRDLDVICLKCLRKNPVDRYATASDLADDLGRFLKGEPIRARPVTATEHLARWCRRNPVVAGLTAAAVTLAAAAVVSGAAAVINLDSARRSANELANQRKVAADEQAELRKADLRRAVKLQVNEGVRLLNDGDFAGAAVLLAHAMAKDPDSENEEAHRTRLGATLRAVPALRQLFHVPVTKHPFALVKGNDARLGVAIVPDEREPLLSRDLTTLLTVRRGPLKVFWDPRTGNSRSVHLSGEDADARIVALSSNGRAVIGLRGEDTRAWDTTDGKPLPLPLAPPFGTLPAPFTPDGSRRLAVGDAPFTVRMIAADGRPVGRAMTHSGDIHAFVLAADGTRVVTGSADRTVRVWDATTGDPLTRPLDYGAGVLNVTLSSDGELVTAVGADGMLQTWDVKTGQPIGHRAQYHHGGGIFLTYNPTRPELATAGWNYGLQVWNATAGRSLSQPMTDTTPIVAFEYSPGGETVVVVDQSRSARIWEPMTATPLTPKLFAGEREVARFTPSGQHLLTVSTGGDVRVWKAPSVRAPHSIVHAGQAQRAEWRPDGRGILSVGLDGVILSDKLRRIERQFPHGTCHGLAVFEADPPILASRNSEGQVRLWEFATGKLAERQIRPPSPVRAMAFTSGGRLAAGGDDGMIRFWDPATGVAEGLTLRHGSKVESLAISRDGTHLLAGTTNRLATLWELPTGRRKRAIPLAESAPLPIFTPDGRYLAIVYGNEIQLVSSEDGHTRSPSFEVGLWSERPVFSADGTYLAAWNTGAKSVVVWEVATGKAVGSPLAYPDPRGQPVLPSLAFSDDGRRLAVGGYSFVMVWEVATGNQLTPPIPNRFTNDVTFSADSRTLLVASGDNTVRTIDLSPDSRPVAEIIDSTCLLANRTLDERGTLVPLTPDEVKRLWESFRPNRPESFGSGVANRSVW